MKHLGSLESSTKDATLASFVLKVRAKRLWLYTCENRPHYFINTFPSAFQQFQVFPLCIKTPAVFDSRAWMANRAHQGEVSFHIKRSVQFNLPGQFTFHNRVSVLGHKYVLSPFRVVLTLA